MIGPASRRHFHKALQLASEAERNLVPGQLRDRALLPLLHGVIELIRGIAFVFLSDEVEIKVKEGTTDE